MYKMYKYLTFLLALVLAFALIAAPMVLAQEKKRIKGEELSTYLIRISEKVPLYPKEARVKVGTTVVWANTSAYYVAIAFTGKQIEVVCKAPVNFNLELIGDELYSNRLAPGTVASLCFIEKGTFKYRLLPDQIPMQKGANPAPLVKETAGTIIVE